MMLEERDRRTLRGMLRHLDRPVAVAVHPGPGGRTPGRPEGPSPWEVVRALADLAPSHIHAVLESAPPPPPDQTGWRPDPPGPLIRIPGPAPGDPPFLYQGVPTGYQFATLVEAVLDASRGAAVLGHNTRRQLAALAAPVQLTVLVVATCPYSPRAVRLARGAAWSGAPVAVRVVDLVTAGDAADWAGVDAVPRILVDRADGKDPLVLDGIPREAALAEAILAVAGRR
jgi:hypothetical protein